MAGTFMSDMLDSMTATVAETLDQFRVTTAANLHDQVFGKFKEQYATLDVETILKVRKALGHKSTEKKPCKVCRFIANKEIDLMDEQTGVIDGPS